MRTERLARTSPGYRRLGRPLKKSELEFNFALGDGVSLLNPDHWDALTHGESLFLSRPFRRLMEDHGPRGVRARYGIIYQKEVPLAAVMVTIAPIRDSAMPVEPRVARRPSGIRIFASQPDATPEPVPEVPERNLVLCGDFYAAGFHGVAVDPSQDIGKLWPAVSALLQKILHHEGMARDRDYILIKDVPATLTADTRVLRRCQFRRFDTSPNMVFTLSPRWESYDDYFAQLNVRHRLVAHRAARDLYKKGIERRSLERLTPWLDRMHELYLSVQRRSGSSYLPLPKSLLSAIADQLDPALYRCSALMQDDAMLGFVLTLKDRDTAVCYCMGWDTEAGRTAPLLSALLHGVIRDAMALDCTRINFGRTALRLKAQLGAHPDQTELWVQHARPELGLPISTILETHAHAPSGEVAAALTL